ncbi:hypothetical protein J6590_000050 [Homalodisca vitripennis]|nr:hypothetical protein J6590_000050 [Homalodisca vitripennis]
MSSEAVNEQGWCGRKFEVPESSFVNFRSSHRLGTVSWFFLVFRFGCDTSAASRSAGIVSSHLNDLDTPLSPLDGSYRTPTDKSISNHNFQLYG